MAQESYYFPHDYNPFDDIQFDGMVAKHGIIGYGVFWRLIEMLHVDADHMLEFEPYIYESVANKLSISSEQVEKII